MLKRTALLTFFALALAHAASAQAPGNMRLLEGYTHTPSQGIDTAVGRISKPGGMTIEYDNGAMAGQYARKCSSKSACLWFKRQWVGGREVWLGMTKEGEIIATFPKSSANFFARTNSPEDVADFLLMVMTYGAEETKGAAPKPKRR